MLYIFFVLRIYTQVPSFPKYPVVSNLSSEDKRKALGTLYPKQMVKTMNPKKKYVCAVCKSVCDLYGLFVHMKQVNTVLLYLLSLSSSFNAVPFFPA